MGGHIEDRYRGWSSYRLSEATVVWASEDSGTLPMLFTRVSKFVNRTNAGFANHILRDLGGGGGG